MKSFFGKESLIIYSKYRDYFKIDLIMKEDIQMYYKLLMNDQLNNQKKVNAISCCLYYLSDNDINYQNIFKSDIIGKLDINKDLINSDNLILIYNIIEFNEIYLKSNREIMQYLLNYLERFSDLNKTITNFLLFKYYRGCLKLNLGDFVTANSEYLETIVYYEDYIISNKKENRYTFFIRLQNDLLNLRIIKNKNELNNRESKIFLKELNDKIKNENKINILEVHSNSNIKGSDVWVNKWIDYSSKFGLGYFLNNGFFGILFNDSSTIILNPETNIFFYIEENPQNNQEVIKIYNIKNYPKELDKKLILLQYCKNDLESRDINNKKDEFNNEVKNDQLEKIGFQNNNKEINKKPYTFVTKYMKTRDTIVFRLYNKYDQVCFKDKTEIILSFKTNVFIYVNNKKERSTYFLSKALEINNIEIIKKLKYAEDILTYFSKINHPKKNENNINYYKNEKNEINLHNFDKSKNIKDKYASYLEEQEKQKIKIKEIENLNKKDEYNHIEEMEKIKNKNDIEKKEMDMKLIEQGNNHKENMLKFDFEFEKNRLEYDIKSQQINSENKKIELEHKKDMELNEMKIKNSFLLKEKEMDNKHKIDEKELDYKFEIEKMRMEYEYQLNALQFKLILEKLPVDKLIELFKPQINNYFNKPNPSINQQNLNDQYNNSQYQDYQNPEIKKDQNDLNLNNVSLDVKMEKDKSEKEQ